MISEKPRDFNPILMLRAFRMQMNSDLDREHLKLFTERAIESYADDLKLQNTIATSSTYEKFNYAFDNVGYFLPFYLKWMVRYVAVTGSVAAEISKDADDIDFFVVVRSHTSWLYRGFLMLGLKLKKDRKVRFVESRNVKNRFCLNFICEERGLTFDRQDIFTFHELLYMKPIYEPEYFDRIKGENLWLKEWGIRAVANRREWPSLQRFVANVFTDLILIPLNFLAFLAQFLFMVVSGHSPNKTRIIREFIRGRIIFYGRGLHRKALNASAELYEKLMKTASA